MDELSEEERAIVGLVRDFVDRDVRPVASGLEHADTYPEKLIEQMKQLGIYGLAIPEPWGAARVSTPCYALVTEELARRIAAEPIHRVLAIGPVPMMRAVAEVTKPLGIKTIVSLNSIMVDGTGMCGGCRVTVDGTMRFACVDGPEFDGHDVDFDELSDRLSTYSESERESLNHVCRGTE